MPWNDSYADWAGPGLNGTEYTAVTSKVHICHDCLPLLVILTVYPLCTQAICEWMGGSWALSRPQNFDDVPTSFHTLFQMSTTSEWVDTTWQAAWAVGMSCPHSATVLSYCYRFILSSVKPWRFFMSTGYDMQPIPDYAPYWLLFFMFFEVFGAFFVLNLFVGIVIDKFMEMKERLGGDILLTGVPCCLTLCSVRSLGVLTYCMCLFADAQREWVKVQEQLIRVQVKEVPKPPTNKYRRAVFDLVTDARFDWFIMLVIIGNTVSTVPSLVINSGGADSLSVCPPLQLVLSMTYFGMPTSYINFLELLNRIFTYIFTGEAILKLIALSWLYFKDNWNR